MRLILRLNSWRRICFIMASAIVLVAAPAPAREDLRQMQDEMEALGGCKMVSPAMRENGDDLRLAVTERLVKLAEEFAAQKKALNFVIIARMGSDTRNLIVLKDEDERGQSIELKAIAEDLVRRQADDLVWREGHSPSLESYVRATWADNKRRIEYSHLGFALPRLPITARVYDPQSGGFSNQPLEAHWGFVHKLKPCKKRNSTIFKQGMGMFFADNPYDYGALVMVPNQRVQKRFRQVHDFLVGAKKEDFFHAAKYNLAAMPFQTLDQNSNQWPLEFLAATLVDQDILMSWRQSGQMRQRAQDLLKKLGYRPTRVFLTGFYSMAAFPGISQLTGGLFDLSQQPYAHQQIVELITVLSISEFLQRNHLLDHQFSLRIQPRWK